MHPMGDRWVPFMDLNSRREHGPRPYGFGEFILLKQSIHPLSIPEAKPAGDGDPKQGWVSGHPTTKHPCEP